MSRPLTVLEVLTVKEKDNIPTLEMSIGDINEVLDQPLDDVMWEEGGYEAEFFDEAERIELRLDYYDENGLIGDEDEIIHIVDGRQADWDSENQVVSCELERNDTLAKGDYYFEWVLVYDEPVDSESSDEVRTVPNLGFFEMTVERATLRDVQDFGFPSRGVGILTVRDGIYIPSFDASSDAPEDGRSIISITGNADEEEGIYRYSESQNDYIRIGEGSGASVEDEDINPRTIGSSTPTESITSDFLTSEEMHGERVHLSSDIEVVESFETTEEWESGELTRANVEAFGNTGQENTLQAGYSPADEIIGRAEAYYPFTHGEIFDSFPAYINGSVVNHDAGVLEWNDGLWGEDALQFVGDTDLEVVSDPPDVDYTLTDWTMFMWVYNDPEDIDDEHRIFWTIGDGRGEGNGYFGLATWDDPSWKIMSNGDTPGTGSVPATNEWVPIALRYDAENHFFEFFVDGVLDYDVDASGSSIMADIDTFEFGERNVNSGGGSAPHIGRMSSAFFFLEPLTDEEIATLSDYRDPTEFVSESVFFNESPGYVSGISELPSGTSGEVTLRDSQDQTATVNIGNGQFTESLPLGLDAEDDYTVEVSLESDSIESTAKLYTLEVGTGNPTYIETSEMRGDVSDQDPPITTLRDIFIADEDDEDLPPLSEGQVRLRYDSGED